MRNQRRKRNTQRKRPYSRRKLRGGQKKNNANIKNENGLFTHAYVINLDSSKDRLDTIMKDAQAAKLKLTRFPAVKIDKSILGDDWGAALQRQGIGVLIYLDDKENMQHAGTIGCYLSHKNLIDSIWKDKSNTALATLIFEDDAIIPEDMVEHLIAKAKDLPDDWDMCFLGKHPVSATPLKGSIQKLKDGFNPYTNNGTWAYMVKNASIKSKIMPTFEIMMGGLDTHYNCFLDKINIYVIVEKLVDVLRKNISDRVILDGFRMI
jgi:GR25 family glycosyltransferase involved in LPS biosynthesis